MTRKTPSERLAILDARYQQQKARIAEQARKKRVRDLIALGELVDRAGLAEIPTETLIGALKEVRRQWDQQGAADLSHPGGVAGAS